MEPERQRPPRPKRQPEVIRTVDRDRRGRDPRDRRPDAPRRRAARAADAKSAPPKSTVVVSQSADFATLDPALAQTPDAWELEYATCARLLDYPPRSGYRGTRLVPEVASALPTISPDRLIYTFHLRPGWKFSDGSSVTAASFARAFERARSPELRLAGRHVSPRGALVAGVRADVDDQAVAAGAGLRRAARAAVLLRRADLGAERSARQPALGRPVRDRRTTTEAGRCCWSGTRTTRVRARRTSTRSNTASARSRRRSGCSSRMEKPTTAPSRPRRSRSSRRRRSATTRICSSCSSRSSRTWR